MMKQDLNRLARLAMISMSLVLALGMSGCAARKAALKEGGFAEDKTALALKTFKEGAQLLFVDNAAARAKFVAAGTMEPAFYEAHFNAGVASEALGQDAEAAKFYQQCLLHKKDEPACLSNLILVQVRLGQDEEANRLVQEYLSEFPEAPFALVAAAQLALAQNHLPEAEKYARAVIEREAENVEALEIMGRVFYAEQKYAAAKWVVKNALELAPAHGGLYLLLGHIFEKLEQSQDALEAYANAIKYLPTEEALEKYGLLLLKYGRVSESLSVLSRLTEFRPSDFRNYLHLGNAYMADKRFDEAKSSYEKALILGPDQKDIYWNLGLLYFDLKPKDMPELDRMKAALGYFKTYLEQPGLSKSRIEEVNKYVQTLNDKINYEEEVAKEAAAAAAEEAAKPKEEPDEKPTEAVPSEEDNPPLKEALPPSLPKEEDAPDFRNKQVEPFGESEPSDKNKQDLGRREEEDLDEESFSDKDELVDL